MHTFNLLSDGVTLERDPMGELVRVSEFLDSTGMSPQALEGMLHEKAVDFVARAGSNVFGTHRNNSFIFADDNPVRWDSNLEINDVQSEDRKRKGLSGLGSFVVIQTGEPFGYAKVTRKVLSGYEGVVPTYADDTSLRPGVTPSHLVDFWVATTDYDLPGTVLGTIAQLSGWATHGTETAYCIVASDQELTPELSRFALSTMVNSPWLSQGEQFVALVSARQTEEDFQN